MYEKRTTPSQSPHDRIARLALQGIGRVGWRCAFTLVEILVVLAIVGVLLGLTLPRLSNAMTGRTLRSSAHQLKLELEAVRHFAITRQTRCRLVIQADAGSYQAFYQPDPLGEPHRYEPVRADGARVRQLGRDVRFASVHIQPRVDEGADAAAAIGFEPTGEADAATLELTDGQQSWTVRVAPATGRVELVAGRPTQPFADRIDLDQ